MSCGCLSIFLCLSSLRWMTWQSFAQWEAPTTIFLGDCIKEIIGVLLFRSILCVCGILRFLLKWGNEIMQLTKSESSVALALVNWRWGSRALHNVTCASTWVISIEPMCSPGGGSYSQITPHSPLHFITTVTQAIYTWEGVGIRAISPYYCSRMPVRSRAAPTAGLGYMHEGEAGGL